MKRRERPWTQGRLHRECWAAPAVWLALCDLAGGSVVCTPTRATLCGRTGIRRERTISDGLTALERGGWIHRVRVPVIAGGRRTATLLRIVLLRRKGRDAPYTSARAVKGATRPKGKGRVAPQDSLLRERACASAALKRTNTHAAQEAQPIRAKSPMKADA
ncbi:MAG: helix-turn-helix domain-containing protein [Phycisphaerae bacterium]|jgi:hypothetical protein